MAINHNYGHVNFPDEYKQYKQPIELKDPDELDALTYQEKIMFAEKLKTELFEHKHREAVYASKRQELLEIENAYRYIQQKHAERTTGPAKQKAATQEIMTVSMEDQLKDQKRKVR